MSATHIHLPNNRCFGLRRRRALRIVLTLVLAVGLLLAGGMVQTASAERVSRAAKRRPVAVAPPPTAAKARSLPKRTAALDPSRAGQTRLRHGTQPAIRRERFLSPLDRQIHCPLDMVAVAGRVCVDRFEGALVAEGIGAPLSPFYPADPALAQAIFEQFSEKRGHALPGSLSAMMPIPEPTHWGGEPRAQSLRQQIPQGYMSAETASSACAAAGKRLCEEVEWVTACRGESGTQFPYGSAYRSDVCNVYRQAHPAFELHGSSSRNHRDPRLNQVSVDGAPLLRRTGETPSCASRWGNDAIYDMVGNLDEWVADPAGAFVGGFYSRGTRSGCFSKVSNHDRRYFDYSTGFRCCKDPD